MQYYWLNDLLFFLKQTLFVIKIQIIATFISRVTTVLLVLKQPFDQTNHLIFRHYFLLLLKNKYTVKTLQVMLISAIYYLSSIVFWGFIYHIYVVYC